MNHQFVIRKVSTAYLVTVFYGEAMVEPLGSAKYSATNKAISDTIQLVANSKLMLAKPDDPVQFLKDHYWSKGWTVQKAT